MLSSRRRRTLSRNDPKLFPVPDDFFPKIELTNEQIQSYENQVDTIVQNALAECKRHEAKGANPIYSAPWVPVGTEGPLTAIRHKTPEGLSHSDFRLFGCIQGNYRDFMDFHYTETSQELFECNQLMYGYAVDAVVLKNIHTKNSGKIHEYLGIKWTCLQPSSLGRKRDNCFLEYLTYVKDDHGRTVGVHVTLPVEIDECPDLYRTLKTKRIQTQSVSIVRQAESSPDATQLYVMSENCFAGMSVSAKSFKKVMQIYNNMSLFVDSKHILRLGVICKTNWVPNDTRKACTSCQLSFHTATRRRYHCRLCGDVFCNRCVIVRSVPRVSDAANKSRIFQVAKTHFCAACISNARGKSEALLTRISSTTHVDNVRKVSSEGNEHKLVSSNMELSSLRPEWWEDIASYRSESDWSETDSDNASKASQNASRRSRLASSLSSSQSSWTSHTDNSADKDDVSFVATLDVINDDVAILDEKPKNSKSSLHNKLSISSRYSISRRHSRKQVQKPRSLDDAQEVTEVIDTTDMIPMSVLRRQSREGSASVARKYSNYGSGGRESLLGSSSSHQSRGETADRFYSSRSISQCLAEQEELLRCMLSVSRVHSNLSEDSKKGASKPLKVDFAATMPAVRPTLQLYDL